MKAINSLYAMINYSSVGRYNKELDKKWNRSMTSRAVAELLHEVVTGHMPESDYESITENSDQKESQPQFYRIYSEITSEGQKRIKMDQSYGVGSLY